MTSRHLKYFTIFFSRVTARENVPFVTKTRDGCTSSAVSSSSAAAAPVPCIEGMYPEIFLELQRLLNFSFSLSVPADRQYGTMQSDGTWNGMIGMLADGEADLSASDFTLSRERAAVVDFLTPLTETHLRLVVRNPSDAANWGVYLNPLTWQVCGVCVCEEGG